MNSWHHMTAQSTVPYLEFHIANVLLQCIMQERAGQVLRNSTSICSQSYVVRLKALSLLDARLAQLDKRNWLLCNLRERIVM